MSPSVAQHLLEEYEAAARMGDSVRAHVLSLALLADDSPERGSMFTESDGVTLLFPL